jgi:hypothetical protein
MKEIPRGAGTWGTDHPEFDCLVDERAGVSLDPENPRSRADEMERPDEYVINFDTDHYDILLVRRWKDPKSGIPMTDISRLLDSCGDFNNGIVCDHHEEYLRGQFVFGGSPENMFYATYVREEGDVWWALAATGKCTQKEIE